jgi:predicted dehydrogenase
MGRTHANDYAKMPGVQLVGVCDTDLANADKLAARCNTQAFASFEQMVEETNPDVVSVCLPTPQHKEFTIKCAELGKHVICEKPIAPTLAEAREMIDACNNAGVRLFIGHVVRFFPSYRDLSRKVASGAIGNIGVAHAKRVGSHPGAAKSWYNDTSLSGGVIMDLMIHDIDFMRSVIGEVDHVYAMNRKTDGLDYALVTLRFVSGAIANLEGFWGYPGPFTTAVELAGNQGVVRFNSNDTVSLQVRKSRTDDSTSGPTTVAVPQSPALQDPYYYELEHFIDCIRTEAAPLVTAEDAYQAVALALAARESVRTGQPVKMSEFLSKGGNSRG